MNVIGIILSLITINAYPVHLIADPTTQNVHYCIFTFKAISNGATFKVWSPVKKVNGGVMCDYNIPVTTKYEITATLYSFDKKYDKPESPPSNIVRN